LPTEGCCGIGHQDDEATTIDVVSASCRGLRPACCGERMLTRASYLFVSSPLDGSASVRG